MWKVVSGSKQVCLRTSKHGQARGPDDELAGRSPSLGGRALCGGCHVALQMSTGSCHVKTSRPFLKDGRYVGVVSLEIAPGGCAS